MEHHAVEFTLQHLIALLPLLVTSLTVVVVMLAIAAKRNHTLTFILSVAGLNLALLSLIPTLEVTPLAVTPCCWSTTSPATTWRWCWPPAWPASR